MILIKGITGGVVAVLVAWAIIVSVYFWVLRPSSPSGLQAIAGGWNYLLQLPIVVLLLSGAFGAGLFLTVRTLVAAGS
jgi:hypothetical protein